MLYITLLGKCNSLIICATNRPQDLDAALLSRFDLMIKYNMPDAKTRIAIIQRYAKQFIGNTTALQQLGEISNRLSCRDIMVVMIYIYIYIYLSL